MLETGGHTFALYSLYVPTRHLSTQQRVLGVALEPSSSQRAPLDVDRGSQEHVRSLGLTLVSELFPHFLGEGDVEGRTQTGGTGETVGWGSVEELDTSDTVGTVRDSDGGDILLGDIDRVPEVLRSANSETWCRVSDPSRHDRGLRWPTFPPRREIFSARDKEERTASTSKSFDSDLEPGRRDESPTMVCLLFIRRV